jgi:hypothetical protein
MGKALRPVLGLANIYLFLIFKRGLLGIILLFLSNIIIPFINKEYVNIILKVFCFSSISMIYFIDYKNELLLFKIFQISITTQKFVKTSIIIIVGLIQWIILVIFND